MNKNKVIKFLNQSNGWIIWKLSCGNKKYEIWLSNVFDPFNDIKLLIDNIKKNKNTSIIIDDERSEKEIFVTIIHKDKIRISFYDIDEKLILFECIFDSNYFINQIITEIDALIKDKEKGILIGNDNSWSNTDLFKNFGKLSQ